MKDFRKEKCVDSITEVVSEKCGQIKVCYDKALQSNPTLQGTLVLEFSIQNGVIQNFNFILNTTLLYWELVLKVIYSNSLSLKREG